MALTVPLAEDIWRVPLIGDFTNGFLLRDADGQVTILDMGLPLSGKRVMKALAAMTQQTAHRLAELDYATAAFTHGPEITDRPREAIRRFLAKAG